MRSEEEIKKIEKEIEEKINNNNYKRIDKEVIESINDIKINEEVEIFNDQLLDTYFRYIENLDILPINIVNAYLNVIKDADLIDNQRTEMENSFLVAIYSRLQNEHAIDALLDKNYINKESLIIVHDLLIKNAAEKKDKIKGFRQHNTNVVGNIVNGEKQISYFPVDYKKIDYIATEITKYINDTSNESREKIFIKPIIIHGLIAAYQMFEDGNTRLARCIQHSKIHHMTNEYSTYNYKLPYIYTSKQYFPCRQEYRDLITNLVLNYDSEAWNKWIIFNMQRIEDALFNNIDLANEVYCDQLLKNKRIIKNITDDMKRI